MPQRPVPPQYRSSSHVLDGISLAFSTLNNPRGLECLWNSPYCQTFSELLCSYQDDKFLIYSPYTLWMPALIRKEQELRKYFEESGVDYDAAPSRITKARLRATALKVRAHRQQLPLNVVRSHPTGSRQSIRNKQNKEKASTAEVEKLEKEFDKLFKERLKIIKKQDEIAEKMKPGNNIHDISIVSFADSTSFEKEPDIFINHVATVEIPVPKSRARKILHRLRAGRKIYHQCGAMIIELKQGPSRLLFGKDSNYKLYASAFIRQSQNDLFQYCSAYFACYPDAESIIAIGTGGPFWSWANIERSSTPKWNYVEGRANDHSPKNKRLISQWDSLFSEPFHLGTKKSDEMLTKINRKYIHAMLAHTPEIPAHLVQEEEESEEEESEEEEEIEDEEEEEEEETLRDVGRWSDEEAEEEVEED